MQTQTIITKTNVEFKKFKNFVYVNLPGEDPFALERTFFDKKPTSPSKLKWLLKTPYKQKYYAYSDEYLKKYTNEGDWTGSGLKKITVNLLNALEKGEEDRILKFNSCNGYLYKGTKPVPRAWQVMLHDVILTNTQLEKFKAHPKIMKIEHCNGYHNDNDYTFVIYKPSVREFNKVMKLGDHPYDRVCLVIKTLKLKAKPWD